MSDPFVGGRFKASIASMPGISFNQIGPWVADYATPDIYLMSGDFIYASLAGYYVIRALLSVPSMASTDSLIVRLDVMSTSVVQVSRYGEANNPTQNQIEYEAHFSGQTGSRLPADAGIRFFGYHTYSGSLAYDAEISIRRVGP